jgi:thiol-disulfide isomerase/thioredoxin
VTSDDLKTALTVVALAAGFALIPRATRGCEGASLDAEAPNWSASVVANAEKLDPTLREKLTLAQLRGHVVLLDFWATWCGPCQAEAPIMNTIAERYKDRGLVVIGINTSDEDGLAARFAKNRRLGFPMVYDQGNAIAREYGASSLPTLVVISKEGRIVAHKRGVTSDAAIDEIVRRYL